MHFIKRRFLFVLVIFIFSSCTGDGAASAETAAKNICECTQSVVELNQKMEALKRSGKIEELIALMEKAGEEMNRAIKCSNENISEKTDREKLKKALVKTCAMDENLAEDLLKPLSPEGK